MLACLVCVCASPLLLLLPQGVELGGEVERAVVLLPRQRDRRHRRSRVLSPLRLHFDEVRTWKGCGKF